MTLRVAQVIDTLKTGGAQSLLATLVENLPAGEVKVDVIILDSRLDNPAQARLQAAGAAIHTLPGKRLADPARLLRLRQQLLATPYDVVHTHLTYANILGVLAARLARRPVIASLHNVRPSHHGRLALALEGLVLPGADKVIAVGQQVAAAYRSQQPGLAIGVVPNAVSRSPSLSPTARQALRAELVGSATRPLLIAVGRLTTQKGYPDLIAAMTQVVCAIPDAALLIVGTGEMRAELEAAIRGHDLDEHVFMLGLREDVPALLAAADLFVSASHWEGLPVALLEAMAAGLPVVATIVGDVSSVVSDETGRLVSPRKPEKLAGAIIELLGNHKLRAKLGRSAVAHAARHYGAAAWTRQMLEMYTSVAAIPGRLRTETS